MGKRKNKPGAGRPPKDGVKKKKVSGYVDEKELEALKQKTGENESATLDIAVKFTNKNWKNEN